MIDNAFDQIAAQYDAHFTHTRVGSSQRQQVWQYIARWVHTSPKRHLLEINCGTGEDALHWARHGHRVLATDAAQKMVDITRYKAVNEGLDGLITAKQLDVTDAQIYSRVPSDVDMVFSNFGGLNCLDGTQLAHLSATLYATLPSGGRFVAVLMPPFCVWETLYFLAKLQPRKAFRRLRTQNIRLADVVVRTWYYTPRQFYRHFSAHFDMQGVQPVGLWVPPSYLSPRFENHPKILSVLQQLDKLASRFGWLGYASDHYLIDLQRK